MARFSSTPDHNAAFLAGCMNKTKVVHVHEELGLYSQTDVSRKEPDFYKNEANELYGRVKQIAKSYVASHRGGLEQLQADLARETAFSSEVLGLGRQYGPLIWGRANNGQSHSSGEQGEELDWARPKDRDTIHFYIRCWIIRIAIKEPSITPRKAKGKDRLQVTGTHGDEHTDVGYVSDSSGSSDVPHCPPEPSRMHPASESRGQDAQIVDLGMQIATVRNNGNTVFGTKTPSNPTNISTPNKRKAPDVHGQTSSGKLTKTFKGMRGHPVPIRGSHRNVYSIPLSPTPDSDLTRPSGLFEKQRQRESTHDTDTTWMPPPRDTTADTETVVGGDEIATADLDALLQDGIASEEHMQYEYQVQTTAGPSGTYRNPLRHDSVIPNDTQNDTTRVILESNEGCPNHSEQTTTGSFGGVITTSQVPTVSKPGSSQQKEQRRELFKLLLSYLNGINQFNTESYNTEAEERMNMLLYQLWVNDAETLHSRVGDDFPRLKIAFESWSNMRHRLSEFRIVTGYFGQPGEQWAAHLQRMANIPCAQAMLAYVDLEGHVSKENGPGYVADSFDDDLARVFDLLTMVKGCNGKEAFKGIRQYNFALLEWFKLEETDR